MNKPSWDDAPEWANFLSQDGCGSWWWFEFRPSKGLTTWYCAHGKREKLGGKNPPGPCEQRPEPKP